MPKLVIYDVRAKADGTFEAFYDYDGLGFNSVFDFGSGLMTIDGHEIPMRLA